MRRYIIIAITILFILSMLIFNCQYEDPYSVSTSRDLLTRLDLSADWTMGNEILLDTTSEAPPSGETTAYSFYFENLVSYDTFEASGGAADFGNWLSSANAPSTREVVTGTEMYGNKYLHLDLDRTSVAQYFYHVFSAEASTDYVFVFDYIHLDGGDIQLSFGDGNADTIRSSFEPDSGLSKARVDFSAFSTAATYQIRFGYANNTPDPESYEANIDNIALFLKGSHTVSKELNIYGSTSPVVDDSTGETFFEGTYRLEIYAKSSTGDKLTLKLGSKYTTVSLTSSWQKYALTAYIYKSDGYLRIGVMPTAYNEADRFPCGIFITRPRLYYTD